MPTSFAFIGFKLVVSVSKQTRSALLSLSNQVFKSACVRIVLYSRLVLTEDAEISAVACICACCFEASDMGAFEMPAGVTPFSGMLSNSRFQLLNSKRSNSSASFALSIGCGARSLKLSCIPTSQRMVISSLAVGSHISASRKYSPTLPLILSALAITPSSVPYSFSHFTAVLGPTLSTPGTLSTLSPMSVK